MILPKLRFLLFLLSSFGLLLSPLLSFAENYSNNIGFIKKPPKELKEKFPMCDQFLDVKWIKQFTEGNWVGMVTADVYRISDAHLLRIRRSHGGTGTVKTDGDLEYKKEQRELVVMQKHGIGGRLNLKQLVFIDVSSSDYRGKELKALILSADKAFSSFRSSTDAIGSGFSVKKDGKWINVAMDSTGMSAVDGKPSRSLTFFSKNVCVSLPNGEAGWLIETNRPFLDNRLMSRAEKIKFEQFKALAAKECGKPNNEIERGAKMQDICTFYIKADSWLRENLVLMDLDGDGLQDYGLGTTFFLNDNYPFVMKIPKQCYHSTYDYYDQHDMQREMRCTAEEKRKFLQNR